MTLYIEQWDYSSPKWDGQDHDNCEVNLKGELVESGCNVAPTRDNPGEVGYMAFEFIWDKSSYTDAENKVIQQEIYNQYETLNSKQELEY